MPEPPTSAVPTERELRRLGSDASARRRVALAVLGAIVLAGLLASIVGGVRTAAGRFAGSTTNDGSLLAAAEIDLTIGAPGASGTSTAALAIDAEGMLPGDAVERCIDVGYVGDLDGVDVRLTGRRDDGGLDDYLATTLERGAGTDPDCSDFILDEQLFDDTLSALWERHASFDVGIPVLDDATDGTRTTVRIRAELRDDNRAQGLSPTFWIELEVRP